jgi:hypothetical protein
MHAKGFTHLLRVRRNKSSSSNEPKPLVLDVRWSEVAELALRSSQSTRRSLPTPPWLPWMTEFGGELLSELPSTSPRVSDVGGLGWPGGVAVAAAAAAVAATVLATVAGDGSDCLTSSWWLDKLLHSESVLARRAKAAAAKSPFLSKLCERWAADGKAWLAPGGLRQFRRKEKVGESPLIKAFIDI